MQMYNTRKTIIHEYTTKVLNLLKNLRYSNFLYIVDILKGLFPKYLCYQHGGAREVY